MFTTTFQRTALKRPGGLLNAIPENLQRTQPTRDPPPAIPTEIPVDSGLQLRNQFRKQTGKTGKNQIECAPREKEL